MDSNLAAALFIALGRALQRLLRPARSAAGVGIGAAWDLTRTRSGLLAENALLRQQVILLRRSIRRPQVHHDDRLLLPILAQLHRYYAPTDEQQLPLWDDPPF